MNRENIKLCALCDNRIPNTHVVCPDHYADYKVYKDEQWFKELVIMQQKQAQIDGKENVTIHKLSENTLSIYLEKEHPTKPDNKMQIIQLNNEGLSHAKIAKRLHIPLGTVKATLRRYKMDAKPLNN